MKIVYLFLFILVSTTFPSDKTRIAILPLEGKNGIDSGSASAFTEILTENLIGLKRFTVVERAKLQSVLKEQALQNSGCTENKCIVQMGNLLNVQKVLNGSISKVGSKVILSVSVIDVEKGKVENLQSFTVPKIDDVQGNLKILAMKLCESSKVSGSVVKMNANKTFLCDLSSSDGISVGQKGNGRICGTWRDFQETIIRVP